ncbi:hypothetical protein TELCIR_11805 [Teladorsagia circumcincta]|uniref:Uncharacterized protein n=1 Tax=Teladorsagia circumcincta TaxID=45464 RepID=A0A2G9U8A4_TELCI|nr:hypothetical protein TELCIR_11805 [Teladorsagia circumcincta]
MVTTTQPLPTKKSIDTTTTPPAKSLAGTTIPPEKGTTLPKTPALRLEGTPLPSAPKEPALRLEGTPLPSASKKPALSLEGTPIPGTPKKPALRLEGTPIPSASKKTALRLEGTPIPGHAPEDGDSEWGRMPESDSHESDIKGDMAESGKSKLQLKGTPVHSTSPPLSKKKVRPSTRKPHSKLDSLSIKPAKHNRKPPPLSVSQGSKGKWKSFPGHPPQDGDSEWVAIPESDPPGSDTTKGKDPDGWAFLPDSATQDSNVRVLCLVMDCPLGAKTSETGRSAKN